MNTKKIITPLLIIIIALLVIDVLTRLISCQGGNSEEVMGEKADALENIRKHPEYNVITPFYFGRAMITTSDLKTVIEESDYQTSIGTFQHHIIKVGFINKRGDIVIPCIYDYDYDSRTFYKGLLEVRHNEKWGVIDSLGNVVIPIEYESTYVFKGSPKLSLVIGIKKDGKWGLLNEQGEIIIPCICESSIGSSNNGLFAVKINGKYGYYDETGVLRIPCMYEEAHSFSEGLAVIKKDGKYGYIDEKNELVIPAIYASAEAFSHETAIVKKTQNGLKAIIDKFGRELTEYKYKMIGNLHEGYRVAEDEYGKYGYLGLGGNELIPFVYDFATKFQEGVARTKYDDGTRGFLLNQYDIPFDYSSAADCNNGFITFSKNGKWGIAKVVDNHITTIVEPKYDRIEDEYEDGLIVARLGDKLGAINEYGKVQIPFEFTDPFLWIHDGSICATKGNRTFLIDYSGEPLFK